MFYVCLILIVTSQEEVTKFYPNIGDRLSWYLWYISHDLAGGILTG